MILQVYGISNCDTVKKALKFFDTNKISYRFHDIRTDGLSEEKVAYWIGMLGSEGLINKKSTTWKGLEAAEQMKAVNTKTAVRAILNNSTIIKRPVVEAGKNVTTGFNEDMFTKYSKK